VYLLRLVSINENDPINITYSTYQKELDYALKVQFLYIEKCSYLDITSVVGSKNNGFEVMFEIKEFE